MHSLHGRDITKQDAHVAGTPINLMKRTGMVERRHMLISYLLCLIIATGCYSSAETTRNDQADPDSDVVLADPSRTLADYLRGVSGVTVTESGGNVTVNVQGNLSYHSDTRPLFVVDGVRYGYEYSSVASAVPVQNIRSVRVLKGSDASSAYGQAGSNGVIEIRMRNRE